jgi:hypothetical protein
MVDEAVVLEMSLGELDEAVVLEMSLGELDGKCWRDLEYTKWTDLNSE